MRLASVLLAVAWLAAPALAQAGVHMHLPHPHHHVHAPPADPSAPKSDVPDPVWATGRTGR